LIIFDCDIILIENNGVITQSYIQSYLGISLHNMTKCVTPDIDTSLFFAVSILKGKYMRIQKING